MRIEWRGVAAITGLIAVLAHGVAKAADIRVLVTGAARGAYEELAPQFERATGHKLVSQFGLPPALVAKVDAGEPFDVIILSYDVAALIKQGKLVAASRTVLGQAGVGVAIRTGAPKPDFSTVEKFKRALLDAKFIATSGEGSSGRYVLVLLDRLGIAEQVKPKIKSGGAGRSAELVAAGEVDFVVSALPPLISNPMIEWLGLIPTELQSFIVFTAGLSSAAKEAQAGGALLGFLKTPAAVAVFKAKGLDPAP
jgi:molybdate transport system substrate-binding protein